MNLLLQKYRFFLNIYLLTQIDKILFTIELVIVSSENHSFTDNYKIYYKKKKILVHRIKLLHIFAIHLHKYTIR